MASWIPFAPQWRPALLLSHSKHGERASAVSWRGPRVGAPGCQQPPGSMTSWPLSHSSASAAASITFLLGTFDLLGLLLHTSARPCARHPAALGTSQLHPGPPAVPGPHSNCWPSCPRPVSLLWLLLVASLLSSHSGPPTPTLFYFAFSINAPLGISIRVPHGKP